MSPPTPLTTLYRRSLIVHLPTDYLVRGLLLPLAAAVLFAIALLGLGSPAVLAAAPAVYIAWCSVPLLLFLRGRRDLELLIRAEQGEPLCTRCGYTRDPALADAPCPECGRPPEPLTASRARVYAICRWAPWLAEADSQSLERQLRCFVRSERVIFWPRLLAVGAGFVITTIVLVTVFTIIDDAVPQTDLRPLMLPFVLTIPLAFIGTLLLLRMRRLLRVIREWRPADQAQSHPPT